jgi:hypothetical protein
VIQQTVSHKKIAFFIVTIYLNKGGTMMKRIVALTVLCFAGVFALGFAPISRLDAAVSGHIYQVTVKSSFGTTFRDCFRFDTPQPGFLTIDALGPAIRYRLGQLDTPGVATSFKAVSLFSQPLSIMFFGEEVEGLEQLNGEAVNEFGDTFVFSGLETPACVLTLDPAAGSPYQQQ